MAKGLFVCLSIIALEVCVALLLLSPSSIRYSAAVESKWIVSSLGKETNEFIKTKANDWYLDLVVDSNLEDGLRNFLFPSEHERRNTLAVREMDELLAPHFQTRLDSFLDLIYWMLRRCALFMVWLPICLPALFVSVIFGLLERQIKRTDFSYTSPTVLRYSWRSCGFLTMLFFMLFVLPLAVPPILVPVVVCFVMLFMGVSLSHLSKKI